MKCTLLLWVGLALPLCVWSAPAVALAENPSVRNPTRLAYASAPPDNPLKGFVTYLREDPTFPQYGMGLHGAYRLFLRVRNPLPNGVPLRFANQTQDQHLSGWLTLGGFRP